MFQPMPIPFDDSCCLRISHFGPVPQLKSSLPSPRNAFRLARSRLRYKSLRPLACQSSSQSGVPAVRILKVAQQPRQIKREIVSFISNLFQHLDTPKNDETYIPFAETMFNISASWKNSNFCQWDVPTKPPRKQIGVGVGAIWEAKAHHQTFLQNISAVIFTRRLVDRHPRVC